MFGSFEMDDTKIPYFCSIFVDINHVVKIQYYDHYLTYLFVKWHESLGLNYESQCIDLISQKNTFWRLALLYCAFWPNLFTRVFKRFVARPWRRRDTRGHSMYENTTIQYKNIHQEKEFSDPFAFLACHPCKPLKLKCHRFSTMLSWVKVWDPGFIYTKMIKACIGSHCDL